MNEVVTWGAIVASIGSLLGLVTFWVNLGTRLTTAEIEASSAKKEAAVATAKYDAMVDRVGDWRVKMTADISVIKTLAEANTVSLTAAENRVAKALEEVRDELGRFNERIDRAFADK